MYCCENKTGPEAQQKALAEARVIIANNQIKDVDTGTTQIASSETKNVLTSTQWLCHQHFRFTNRNLLQTRRDPKLS